MNKKLIISLLLLTLIPSIPVYATDYETQIQQNQNLIQNKKAEQQSISSQMEQLMAERLESTRQRQKIEGDMEKMKGEIEDIQAQIEDTTSLITQSELEIQTLNEEISQKQSEIIKLNEEKTELEEILDSRLRALYKTSPTQNFLLFLFESNGLLDFTERIMFSRELAEQDQRLIARLESSKMKIAEEQGRLEGLKAEVLSVKKDLEYKKIELSYKNDELMISQNRFKKQIQEILAIEAELSSSYQKMNKAQKELAQSIGDIMNENASLEAKIKALTSHSQNSEAPQGAYARPVQGRITSPYGWRIHPIFNVRRMHTGVDFAGPIGTPILATQGGVVIEAAYLKGYGNTVIIDHGGGMTSLYAHMSKIGAAIGETVGRGQTIGLVGSTGDSTGPHLHFEIRKDGNYLNPMDLL